MYQKNIKEQIAPASITKLMTAILLLDSYSIDEKVNLQIDDPNIEGKIAYFKNNKTMKRIKTKNALDNKMRLFFIHSTDGILE